MTPEQQSAFLERAEILGCLVHDRVDGRHRVEDPYEVRWEIVSHTE
jgi:hypothetical protein